MTSPRWPAIHITEIEEVDGKKFESVLTSPVCDLCGDAYPCWDYECPDFSIEHVDFGSWGDWAACQECSELIEKDDYEGLLQRALDNPAGHADPEYWRRRISPIHQGFRERRVGERIAWG